MFLQFRAHGQPKFERNPWIRFRDICVTYGRTDGRIAISWANKRPMGLDGLLENNLGICPSSRSCTYTPFLPHGSKLSSFSVYGQQFPRYGPNFKLAIFVHKTFQVAKVPEVAHMLRFYPKGSKLSVISLYGQRFPRYRLMFKIAIFRHETLLLAKVPEVAHIPSFYPRGSKLSLFLLYE